MILVIDDDKATRVLISEIVSLVNIKMIEACDGKEALLLFEKYAENIKIIFLDIRLPDISGWDLIKLLRAKHQTIPIIALSAINPRILQEKSEISGFTSYLSKPFGIKQFLRTVVFYLKSQPDPDLHH